MCGNTDRMVIIDLCGLEKNDNGFPMRKPRFESYESILLALVNGPISESGLVLETCLDRGSLRSYLYSLVASGLVERRSAPEIVLYAITEKGLAVIRVLSFRKYLEKIGGLVRTLDEALRVIPELSGTKNASEK